MTRDDRDAGQRTDPTVRQLTEGGPRAAVDPLPEDVESTAAKLVLLHLRVRGVATVDELVDVLGQKRMALYPILRTLVDAGHAERRGAAYVST